MTLNVEEFHEWKKSNVTEALFEMLLQVRHNIEDEMCNSGVIMDADCQKILVRALGIREGIDLVLGVTFDDINSEETNDNDA